MQLDPDTGKMKAPKNFGQPVVEINNKLQASVNEVVPSRDEIFPKTETKNTIPFRSCFWRSMMKST